MRNAGKLVIVAIVAIALALALFSLWYHRQGGRRSLEFWGTEAAVLIARAPQIECIELSRADQTRPAQPLPDQPAVEGEHAAEAALAAASGPGDRPIQRLGIGGRFYTVEAAVDSSHARGVSNIRRAMVLDATYRWDADADAEQPTWQYAMEFRDQARSVMVLFDFERGVVGSTSNTRLAVLEPAAVHDWSAFCEEQFAPPRGGAGALEPAAGEPAK